MKLFSWDMCNKCGHWLEMLDDIIYNKSQERRFIHFLLAYFHTYLSILCFLITFSVFNLSCDHYDHSCFNLFYLFILLISCDRVAVVWQHGLTYICGTLCIDYYLLRLFDTNYFSDTLLPPPRVNSRKL